MKTMTRLLVLLFSLLLGACGTHMYNIDRAFEREGFEKLYGSHNFSVFYDHFAERCVAYAFYAGGGTGIDTFSCNVDTIRERVTLLDGAAVD